MSRSRRIKRTGRGFPGDGGSTGLRRSALPFLVFAACALLVSALIPSSLRADTDKLSFEQKVELLQGMSAEFAVAKVTLPRSRKPLRFYENGTWDVDQWDEANFKEGPAARPGDQVQITKMDIDDDKITIQLNDGTKKGSWLDRIQVGMGNQTVPVTKQQPNAAAGTTIEVRFEDSIAGVDTERLKEILAPLMDFDERSATELYIESLPPPVQEAIKDERAIEGMDHDQVLLALGRPRDKVREYKDNTDFEEWIYGRPPGVIRFIKFVNGHVVEIQESFAGLGGAIVQPPPPDN